MIQAVVLGSGRRLFPEHADVSLRLTDSDCSAKGVVITTYEPAGD
jgi:hypothetical protein